MTRRRSGHGNAFVALQVPPFRLFISGQALSLIGSWVDTVAQALLILQLTNSGLLLGLVTAARYAPVLLLGPFAGVVVDRVNRRTLLLITQSTLALLSLTLGTLILTGTVTITAVFIIAVAFGCATALDNPTRQAFVPEMVGPALLRNAVTLNSTFVNVGRAVGPIAAAALISTVGIGWCFIANAVSFSAVLTALILIRPTSLHPAPRPASATHLLRSGLRYAAHHRAIAAPLAMMALIGTFTYEFEVSLPLLARTHIDAGPTTYSWLIGAFGVGSVIGGLWCAARPAAGSRRLLVAAAGYCAAMTAAALSPWLWCTVISMLLVGLASITFLTTGNANVQLAAPQQLHGRMTALWSTAFVGTTPIGATIIGQIGAVSPHAAMLVGAGACLAAFAVGGLLLSPNGLRPKAISESS